MKRNSRILALILTLCLLCSAVITTAFADTGIDVSALVANQLKAKGATNYPVTSIGMGSFSTGNSTANKNGVDAKGGVTGFVFPSFKVKRNIRISVS